MYDMVRPFATEAPDEAATGPPVEAVDKLLELARRYYELRLVSIPFEKWQVKASEKRPKRINELQQRRCLALRHWQRSCKRWRLCSGLNRLVTWTFKRPSKVLFEVRVVSARLRDFFLRPVAATSGR